MNEEDCKKLSIEIEHFINNFDSNNDYDLVQSIMNFHRTLQQKFFGNIILNIIRMMHNDYIDKYYDDRNEIACKIAYDMYESLKNIKNSDGSNKYNFTDNVKCHLPTI